jgi:hypothetical protein
VKTTNINIITLENRCNNKKSKFPWMFELSKSESNMVDYNLFFKDYDEYNATKN